MVDGDAEALAEHGGGGRRRRRRDHPRGAGAARPWAGRWCPTCTSSPCPGCAVAAVRAASGSGRSRAGSRRSRRPRSSARVRGRPPGAAARPSSARSAWPDQDLGLAVGHDVRGFGRREMRVHRDEVEARLSIAASQHPRNVRWLGSTTAMASPRRRPSACSPRAIARECVEELAVGEHPTVGVDDRDAIGIGGRDAPEAEPGAVHEKRDYCFSEMADEFRDQLRARFAEHHPGPPPKGREARLAWQRAWCATAVDHELAGPSWPREYGGMDLTFEEQVVYAEEAARARVPGVPGTGVGIAGPTIIRYGTEEQKRAVAAPDAARRRDLGPGLLRTRGRFRPAGAAHDSGARRRPLRRQRPEGVELERRHRRHPLQPGAHRRSRLGPRRHHLPADRCARTGRDRAPAARHDRRLGVLRDLLRRRRGTGREPHRRGEPRLGHHPHQPRPRARRRRASPRRGSTTGSCASSRRWPGSAAGPTTRSCASASPTSPAPSASCR